LKSQPIPEPESSHINRPYSLVLTKLFNRYPGYKEPRPTVELIEVTNRIVKEQHYAKRPPIVGPYRRLLQEPTLTWANPKASLEGPLGESRCVPSRFAILAG